MIHTTTNVAVAVFSGEIDLFHYRETGIYKVRESISGAWDSGNARLVSGLDSSLTQFVCDNCVSCRLRDINVLDKQVFAGKILHELKGDIAVDHYMARSVIHTALTLTMATQCIYCTITDLAQ